MSAAGRPGYCIKLIIVLAAIVFACPQHAESRCARATYVVSGTVHDCETSQPVPGVQVMVFLDDDSSAWPTTEGTSSTLSTDSAGAYHGEYHLDLYSGKGFWMTDRCNRRPRTITMVCAAQGYSPIRLSLRGKDIPPLDESLAAAVLMEPIYLAHPGKAPCGRRVR